MTSMRVVLADDHTLFRAGLRALLEKLPDVQVVAEARDGYEAVHMVETHHPDLVLMDIAMPGLNGLEATRRLVKAFPAIRVLILSMHKSEEYVWQALRAGAVGYLLKDAELAELALALTAVTRGETYLSPPISKHLIRDYDAVVGQRLGLGVKTVETHRTQMMERLGIHDIAGLVRYAIRMGMVLPDP